MRKLIAVLLLFLPTLTLQAQDFTPVEVLIPKFQSPKREPEIGPLTASLLGFQIWRTYSTTTQGTSSFDNADILYNSQSIATTYEEAEILAMSQPKKPNLVLWGKASQYGNGIVVEPNLLIRKDVGRYRLGTKIWIVKIFKGTKSYTVAVDVPSWQYEFAPIVLDPSILFQQENPNSFRPGVKIYRFKSVASEVIASVRESYIRAIKHEGDWSQVKLENLNHQVGWIYLPNLSKNPSEVVNFCGGIIRILRKDWSGAITMFQDVLKTSNVPTAVKIDSYLYMAIAYDRIQDQAKSFSMVAEAYSLDPYSKTTTKYLYMSYLAQLSLVLPQRGHSAEVTKIVKAMQELLSRNKVLFAADDPWIKQAERVLAELAS
ncbi:MAG TPA: hypothetical protein VGO68_11845 [Pyrinomonadaceae bacterium]|jgi:hypothetical protein|nr:hypothetical protein [Pyrinomonadaceae bacterium]